MIRDRDAAAELASEAVGLTHEQLTDELGAELAHHTIGFVDIATDKLVQNEQPIHIKDAKSAGSGTLVRIGSIEGVLTAAHVIRRLHDIDEVGIAAFNRSSPHVQSQTVDMALTDAMIFYVKENGSRGPDIGFLRLPEKNISNLKATHTFLELKKPAKLDQPNSTALDSFVGVVDEWTDELEPLQPLDASKPPMRRKWFKMLLGSGVVSDPRVENGFDLFNLRPTLTPPPSSYAGVSGGAVWRVYVDPIGDRFVLKEKQLIGVPFFEVLAEDDALTLVCHGPRSIYDRVIPEVLSKM